MITRQTRRDPAPTGWDPPAEQALRWQDIATPVGRGPALASAAADPALSRTLETVHAHLIRASGGRTSPSAGGIYPFEVWLHDPVTGAYGSVDLLRRTVLTRGPVAFGDDADLIVALRPWLSTRKYGPRGVAYGLLDAGHALLNLQLATAGSDARLIVGGHRIGPGLPVGRLPVARLSGPLAGTTTSHWSIEDLGPDGVIAEVGDYESDMAARLGPHWSVPLLALPRVRPEVAAGLSPYVQRRRSAAKFRPGLPPGTVEELCQAAVGSWHDLTGAGDGVVPAVRLTLFDRRRHAASFTGETFFFQEHLSVADALVALAVAMPEDDAPIAGEVALALLATGLLGQCVHLHATRLDVAVTGVGGFRPEVFRTSPDAWPVYCVAFGAADEPAVKGDAQATPVAHGFST